MKEKTVLITGASQGLGTAISKKLAPNYNLILNYNTSIENIEQLKKELEENYNKKYMIVKADISKEEEVKEMINSIIKEFGNIDILINNAAIADDCLIQDKTIDDFKRVIDVNLIGTFIVSKYVSKLMINNKSGKIINISSTNGIDTNYPESIDYDASKAGVISLTHNFALELAPYITVNCIAPGWINTNMNINMDDEFKKIEEDKILLNRFGNVEEIANVVEFLVSDKSSYINNTIIRVDGGKR